MRFAAIDIGSNAVRLLFANVFENNGQPIFKKESLIRVPLRLGEEAFIDGELSDKKIEKLVKTMHAFRNLMEVNEVISFKACATSAMREAKNSDEVIALIREKAGVDISVINGRREAEIIYSNHIAERLDRDKNYLYIDVGGGSTEISLFTDGKMHESESFKIGTLRILNNQLTDADWLPLKKLMMAFKSKYDPIVGIGTGGNINKLYKLFGNLEEGSIDFLSLKEAYSLIKRYTYAERVKELGLKPDRADVILPASEIFLRVMQWANIETILVPKLGLSDGIVHILYDDHKKGRATLMQERVN